MNALIKLQVTHQLINQQCNSKSFIAITDKLTLSSSVKATQQFAVTKLGEQGWKLKEILSCQEYMVD